MQHLTSQYSILKKCFSIGNNIIRKNINTSGYTLFPNRRFYDNQTFYENVRFGHKYGHSNIRNIDRNVVALQKSAVQLRTVVRIVDNSAKGLATRRRNPRVIRCYNKRSKNDKGCVGDMVRITLNGEMVKAFVVGQKQPMGVLKPRMDSNNVILLDDDGNPLGTRITVPIPAWLRNHKHPTEHLPPMSKIIAIASSFI